MSSRSLLFLAIGATLAWWLMHSPNTQGVVNAAGGIDYPGYDIHSLESFTIDARVLSVEHYRMGREADLSPLDLALGWGPMKDPAVLDAIQISQGNRWYYWKAQSLPIPRKDITNHSANVHIIPANESVAQALKDIESGDQVRLQGQLVKVTADDGWRWVSSLTRTDTGAGSCELLWLESLTRG